MAQVEVEWTTTVEFDYKAVIDVPEDMTPEEFREALYKDPHEYLPGEEEGDNEQGCNTYDRDVTNFTAMGGEETTMTESDMALHDAMAMVKAMGGTAIVIIRE